MVLTAMVLTSTSLVGTAGAAVRVPKRGGYFGAFANESGDQYSALRAFERIVGRKIKIANKYHPFRTGSLSFEADALRGGRIPLISWRGTDSGTDPNRASKIAAGQYDSVIRSMADRVKALSGRVLIRFNWEMDQSPGDRQFIGEPKEFIAAWRHIVGIFRQRGARNAEWVWAPRAGSFSHGEGQLFYPGGRWVDWIGGSAVPLDNWNSFRDIFHEFYGWAAKRSKPVFVWTGIREKPGSTTWKSGWISNASTLIRNNWPRVKAFVYYHSRTPSGYNMKVNSSTRALRAYRAMGDTNYFRPGTGTVKMG
jgi:hypothetical protein